MTYSIIGKPVLALAALAVPMLVQSLVNEFDKRKYQILLMLNLDPYFPIASDTPFIYRTKKGGSGRLEKSQRLDDDDCSKSDVGRSSGID